jgi:hypothetical protein
LAVTKARTITKATTKAVPMPLATPVNLVNTANKVNTAQLPVKVSAEDLPRVPMDSRCSKVRDREGTRLMLKETKANRASTGPKVSLGL